ncbi:hypothetical protein [Streptomyces sp. NPDC002463]|uniref:hypothetical protein n=1 Tax=Streptomyces sp. NPDC002463 TaxID=3364645 RepID=UPI00367A2BFA
MLFLAHLDLRDHVVCVFMCRNSPGECEERHPWAGANRARVFSARGLTPHAAPDDGRTSLAAATALTTFCVDVPEHKDAASTVNFPVLGQLGGRPDWLQQDETPSCPSCGRVMDFVAQFEDKRDQEGPPYFGTGCAYVFACGMCMEAVCSWQC